jgi:acetyl esterase/lipase
MVACVLLFAALVGPVRVDAADAPHQRTKDVIYGRKHGVVLTMDVFTPTKNANGLGVMFVISGGWHSSHQAIDGYFLKFITKLTRRGYTIFAVVHGSQPTYTIEQIFEDIKRAVRYIRHHAKEYNVDPDHLGVTGMSAGGHLSCLIGTAGEPPNAQATNLTDRYSSRVQAVACFYPPTDFLNYGKPGENAIGRGTLKDFKAPFDFREPSRPADGNRGTTLERITDEERITELGRRISPITHVTPDDPPTLIIHGDADKLVPIQQAETLLAKLEEAGVPTKLVVKPGAKHGWENTEKDMQTVVDWFDVHLTKKE